MRGTVRSTVVALVAATAWLGGATGSSGAAAPIAPQHAAVGGFASPAGDGFSLVFADGSVRPRPFGDAFSLRLAAGIVGGSRTPKGDGYWVVASDGNVYSYGNAHGYGGTGGGVVNAPTVGIAATLTGKGYWLAARDGGVFAFGDAAFRGSATGRSLHQPIVGISASPAGGYRLVARDGGVFGYGNATYRGSLPARHVRVTDIVGMATTPSGEGYWLARSDGRVYDFGDAQHFGGVRPPACDRITAIVGNPSAPGYRLVTESGRTYARGDAPGGAGPTGFRRSCGNTTARIELPRTMLAQGSSMVGHVIVDNQTGAPLRIHDAHGCKPYWGVYVGSAALPNSPVIPQDCRHAGVVFPTGQHQFTFTINTRRNARAPGDPVLLPPGNYSVMPFPHGGRFPNIASVPITIVAPA